MSHRGAFVSHMLMMLHAVMAAFMTVLVDVAVFAAILAAVHTNLALVMPHLPFVTTDLGAVAMNLATVAVDLATVLADLLLFSLGASGVAALHILRFDTAVLADLLLITTDLGFVTADL